MPLDAVTLHAVTLETAPILDGAKIERVQQPERDMLILSVRGYRGSRKLLIAAGSGNARVHFTNESFENPAQAPMFCMLLRKHLVGARIVSVNQPEMERMLVFELLTRDELGIEANAKLIVELMGRSSNVILVDSEGRIVDCMRRMDFGGDAERRLLPGMIYRFPPKQNKTPFFDCDEAEMHTKIASADRGEPMDKWLLSSFSGLSPLICRELAFACGEDYGVLDVYALELREIVAERRFTPYMLSDENKPADFSFMPIAQYGTAYSAERFDSFSELLDAFYSRRDKQQQQIRRARDLRHSVKTARDRVERKLATQRTELLRTEDRDKIQREAELITANIYRLKKGDRVLECEDYYESDAPTVSIELDPLKTPQQNAAAKYREYNKLKTARERLSVFIEQGESQLEYLNSVLTELDMSETERDIFDIRRELIETGYIRPQKGVKNDKTKAQAPMRFISSDDYEILVGRSNTQNDELTNKLARRTDIWLHAKRAHGSHVIIRCLDTKPPERTIEEAAVIAAYYSQDRDSGKATVDYTLARFVKKQPGGMPGMVLYTDYKSITVTPDASLCEQLRVK